MASYTVSLDPSYGAQVEIRLCRTRSREAVKFIVRDGETITSDDPDFIAALNTLVGLRQRVLVTRAQRPPAPTHDVDSKTREPLPAKDPIARAK